MAWDDGDQCYCNMSGCSENHLGKLAQFVKRWWEDDYKVCFKFFLLHFSHIAVFKSIAVVAIILNNFSIYLNLN